MSQLLAKTSLFFRRIFFALDAAHSLRHGLPVSDEARRYCAYQDRAEDPLGERDVAERAEDHRAPAGRQSAEEVPVQALEKAAA